MDDRWNKNYKYSTSDEANRLAAFSRSGNDPRRVHNEAQLSYPGYDTNRTPPPLNYSTSRHYKSLETQSSTSYKFNNQMSRHTNGCVSSTSSFECSIQQTCDPDIERIANNIQSIWATWKQSKVLSDTLRNFFEICQNPYSSLLKLINVISEDRIKGKASTIIYTITQEFNLWIKYHETKYEYVLTDELKSQAFKIILEKKICSNTTNIIVSIYKCNTCLDLMENLIRESIKQKKFKEACYASISLNIQDRFSVEDFLIPLFLMNLVSVTEEFLVTSRYHQEALVKYFDDLLVENDDCLYQIAKRLNVIPANNNFSNKSQIKTNLSRIMKKYKIPNELAPNITKQKKKGALKFMFHRYQSGVTGIDGWREMVLESIGNDEDMMLEIVKMLDNYGDIQESVYFAQLFSIDPSLLPTTIQQELLFSENASANIDRPMPIEEHKTVEYHELYLPDQNIHVIDCASKFIEVLDKINDELSNAHLTVVGLDCEWKPELTSDKSDLASIQFATIDAVHIFHIPQLQPIENFKINWEEFSMNIFSNINIIKLGFEWKGDASMIRSTLPLDNLQLNGQGFIDIKILWKELETKWNFQLPYQNPNEDVVYNSLSDLVKLCFGKPLNKTEQFSNWEKIPLRFNQIKYAALDAYCLLEIFNIFKTISKARHIPFDEVCQQIMNNSHPDTIKSKPRHKKHKRKIPITNMKSKSPHSRVSSVKDFKLLVSNTLEKLAERLRKCGIDTSIVERSKINDYQYIVNLIKTNNLYFIAFGHVFSKVAEQLYIGQSYCVQNHNLDDQVQEVLNYFKIVVKKEDLNSRCQCCNSNNQEIVSCSVMKQIYETIKSIQNQPVRKYRPPSINENDDDDNLYVYEDDYSEDEGTYAPIKTNLSNMTISSITKFQEPQNILLSGYTNDNVEINIKPLSIDMFNDKHRTFNICNNCGSISWDNSHWESALGSSLGIKNK